MPALSIPHTIPPRLLYQGAANAVACDVVSCKNAKKVTFVIVHTGANDTDLVLSLYEATDVAAGTNAAITKVCPVWLDADAGASSDTLVAQTAAYSLTIDPATQNGVVAVIEWDPVKHTDGYDCVYLADSGGHASNVCTILAFVEMKDQSASPASVIVD